MINCDVCGEDMTDETDKSKISYAYGLIGVRISLKLPKKSGKVHHEICRVLEHFGKTEFKICYVCWLKSLGVKERK